MVVTISLLSNCVELVAILPSRRHSPSLRCTDMRWLANVYRPVRSRASLASRFVPYSTMRGDSELGDFLAYMEKLKNYERLGVPTGAGTDSGDGFDLGRIRRLLRRLGDPQSDFKAVHIAGTKGKGSTAAFLSNILREEGYSVGCYTSPHLLTIRERISCGKNGEPVSAVVLKNLFHQVKRILDESVELESGALTHFEVFTALAFAVFSQEKVDIAIIEAGLGGARDATNVLCSTGLAASVITTIGEEHLSALGGSLESIAMAKSGIIKHGRPLVIGGPLDPHIEHIIRDRAHAMNSPVISACDSGVQSSIKCLGKEDELPYQSCDIHVRVKDDLQLSIDLPNVRLRMVGNHQFHNAITATCTTLCLRDQGWKVSDKSIRTGLERTQLRGRSQFLTSKEVEEVGLSQSTILLDGAHTEASAKCLADILEMIYPDRMLALVVAMANDKNQLAFARQLLSGRRPEIVILTEATIAGGRFRIASASSLKDAWIRSAVELGINFLEIGMFNHEKPLEGYDNCMLGSLNNRSPMLIGCKVALVKDVLKVADELLKCRARDQPGVIAVTGSLHIVSSLLAALHQ